MILILAGPADEGAAALADAFAPAPAAVVGLAELASEPSVLRYPSFGDSAITAGGERIGVADIAAVVNLLRAVIPEELNFYDPTEREYQAAELHAWLTFFLASLACPVIGRPSPLSLNGPVLGPLGWRHLALRAGLALAPLELDTEDLEAGSPVPLASQIAVTVVDGRAVTPSGTPADEYAVRLGRHAAVEHLRAWFTHADARFAGATAVPDSGCEATRAAIVARLG